MACADAALDRAGHGIEATARYIRDVARARAVLRPERGRSHRALLELAERREVRNG